jgi:serine-type anaerobic sulfatase-maturating enzyme
MTPTSPQETCDVQQAFHILAKPTGSICNLDCKYCYFLSKEMLYPGSKFRMADELLETYIRQTIQAHQGPEVVIAWQGGEPTLMGLDFFRRSIAYEKKYLKPGFSLQNTLQTNGTLLNDEWCEFFRENDFLIGLSIDGPREMHDLYRVDKGGQPTFDKVLRAARLMQKHGVEFNVLTTVHAGNGDHPLEVYRFLRDEVGTRFIQLIPIIERATPELLPLANLGWGGAHHTRPLYTLNGDVVTERSIKSEQWGQFLIRIFDEWVRRDVGTVFVNMFDAALASWVGVPPALCVFLETCGQAMALEHNGDVYSCDHFVEPKYLLGNIHNESLARLAGSEQQRIFGNNKRDTLPRYCRECDVRFACHGECPKNRFIETPEGEPGLNYLCSGYKAFFHHVDRPMKIMAELLRRDRAPAEVMQILSAEKSGLKAATVKAGRNDPCPCGSGRKFKFCHGEQRSSVASL